MRLKRLFDDFFHAVSVGRRAISVACWFAVGGWFMVYGQSASGTGQPLPPPPPPVTDFRISADVDLVVLDVSVKDHDGGFVSGLTKDDFKVFENGKEQAITQFQNADQPVTVGLIVDSSGSMRSKRPEVITAALVFIGASNPLDEIFVINFNDKIRRGLPDTRLFSDDINELRKALWMGPSEGRTALYDAIMTGLKQLDMGRQAKKTLIVVSDGGDNISTHNFKSVEQAVMASRATIYTIGVYSDDDRDKNPGVLKKLAEISGGVAYFPSELKDVSDICRRIAKDIRSRYTIAFVPQDLSHPGVKHIKVEAFSPERGGKLVTRTRTSYVAQGTATADRRKP